MARYEAVEFAACEESERFCDCTHCAGVEAGTVLRTGQSVDAILRGLNRSLGPIIDVQNWIGDETIYVTLERVHGFVEIRKI